MLCLQSILAGLNPSEATAETIKKLREAVGLVDKAAEATIQVAVQSLNAMTDGRHSQQI